MELESPILFQASYATLQELISAVNIFTVIQSYAVVRRLTKKIKKRVLQKAILMYNRSKVHVDE